LTPDIGGLTNLLDGNTVSSANLALIGNDADHGAIVQLHGVRKSGAIALSSRGDGAAGCCTQDGIARCPATAAWGCHQPNSPTDQCACSRIRLQLDLLDVADGAESNGRSWPTRCASLLPTATSEKIKARRRRVMGIFANPPASWAISTRPEN
jgi:hypothetical protein